LFLCLFVCIVFATMSWVYIQAGSFWPKVVV
jgi:hypothetical protein